MVTENAKKALNDIVDGLLGSTQAETDAREAEEAKKSKETNTPEIEEANASEYIAVHSEKDITKPEKENDQRHWNNNSRDV